ncbi:MAG: hypothetical protein JO332_01245 [Planctomycetaceae bacterium]|nr:hypothetical protein [Planctomycetaceae bacterium]
MPVFRTLSYLAPLIVGFGVAAALALTTGRPARRRAIAAGGTAGSVLGLLLLLSFTDSPKYWGPLALLLLSVGLLVAGVYLLAEAARLPRELCQIVAGLVLSALMSTLFWAGPLIRAAADQGASGDAIDRRITMALAVNPLFVTSYGIFDADLLHAPYFYTVGMADFQHGTPSWGASSAGFAIAGLVFGAVAVGLRRLRKP